VRALHTVHDTRDGWWTHAFFSFPLSSGDADMQIGKVPVNGFSNSLEDAWSLSNLPT